MLRIMFGKRGEKKKRNYSKRSVLFIYTANAKIVVNAQISPIVNASIILLWKYKYSFAGNAAEINPNAYPNAQDFRFTGRNTSPQFGQMKGYMLLA